jgi:hypothetical protein
LSVGVIAAAVVVMASMPVVHEHVHQRARGEEQPGQIRDEMRAMLGHDEETDDDDEQDEYLLHPSAYDVLPRLALFIHGVLPWLQEAVDWIIPLECEFTARWYD